MNFYSLSSGSSGNCYYLGDEERGILIDAGISAGAIRKFLKEIEIPVEAIKGILVTHHHTDHIKGLGLIARKNYLPVFTTAKIWKSAVPRIKKTSGITVREITIGNSFMVSDFEVEAFLVSHDAPETIGFKIGVDGQVLTIATDLGYISRENEAYLKAANVLVIESNYDEEMLKTGNYPAFLKNRILSERGHLCNQQTADFIAENIDAKLRHICLAHLSNSNNTPELAYQTVKKSLAERGVEDGVSPEVTVLNRRGITEAIKMSGLNLNQ